MVGVRYRIHCSNRQSRGGNWQIISDNPVTAGYWWESSFEPQISCPEDNNIVEISIVPSNNDSTSTALSPLFNLDLIIDGKRRLHSSS